MIVSETMIILGAVYAAALIRFGEREFAFIDDDLPKALIIAGVTQVCLYLADLYDFRVITDRRELFVQSVQALGAASLILAAVYYWFPEMVVGRGVFALTAVLVMTLVFGWRLVFEWTSRHLAPRQRLLVVGTTDAAARLGRELHGRADLGVEIVGFIDPDPAKLGTPMFNPAVIGTIEDIPAIVRARNVDRVVVSLSDARGKLPMDKLLDMRLQGVRFEHLASIYERYTGKIAVDNLRPSWLIFSEGFRNNRLQDLAKRGLDVMLSAACLVVALPIMAVIALAVRWSSPGPALYHQERVGQHGRVFVIHKFRSMRSDAERDSGAVWAQADDTRVTPIGAILRRTRLDELPQLWNVLCGHMSIVGPRPERPEFVTGLTKQIPYYGQRHTVRPGLTGWAQVRYTYGASVEDALMKLQYDLYYIKNRSLAFDLFIMLKTVKTVLMRKGGQ
ncbi:MAG TPA: TIGR03013 family XrtA/PEP-CTERM system glycosyltransferase [Vicinamibacterales bacterium]